MRAEERGGDDARRRAAPLYPTTRGVAGSFNRLLQRVIFLYFFWLFVSNNNIICFCCFFLLPLVVVLLPRLHVTFRSLILACNRLERLEDEDALFLGLRAALVLGVPALRVQGVDAVQRTHVRDAVHKAQHARRHHPRLPVSALAVQVHGLSRVHKSHHPTHKLLEPLHLRVRRHTGRSGGEAVVHKLNLPSCRLLQGREVLRLPVLLAQQVHHRRHTCTRERHDVRLLPQVRTRTAQQPLRHHPVRRPRRTRRRRQLRLVAGVERRRQRRRRHLRRSRRRRRRREALLLLLLRRLRGQPLHRVLLAVEVHRACRRRRGAGGRGGGG
eukprot:Rhum_TRINITY_DN14288_c37_g1::Rhum_TRINITY_DN14288_c37_g1_i1::g.74151::m.74151